MFGLKGMAELEATLPITHFFCYLQINQSVGQSAMNLRRWGVTLPCSYPEHFFILFSLYRLMPHKKSLILI